MDCIEIEIINWGKHQRKDVKKPSWFALDNRILEDSKLFDLSDSEWKALIYIFSQASQQGSENVRLNYAHATRVCGISKKTLDSAISRLSDAGVTRTLRERHADVTPQDRTRQDKTEQDKRESAAEPLHPLIELWNENCGDLAKVKKSNKARNRKAGDRWPENSPDEWLEIIRRIANSSFCNGKSDRGWVATFDWLLQPDTHLKVAEGKYDNREGSSSSDDFWKNLEGA